MSYTKGELEVTAGNEVWHYSSEGKPIALLPHSCDEWEIGGVEQIDDLVADLIEAKKKIIAQLKEQTNE